MRGRLIHTPPGPIARRFWAVALCLSLLGALASGGRASAAPRDGSLDASLGGDGKVTVDFRLKDAALGVGMQAGGKIVLVGNTLGGPRTVPSHALTRLLPNGRVDPSFGAAGKVVRDPTPGEDYTVSAVVQPDGKIVVLSYYYRVLDRDRAFEGYTLVRYNKDGSLDRGFGRNGTVIGSVSDGASGSNIGTTDIALQGAKILVLGSGSDAGGLVIERYNADGSRDRAFGTRGRATAGRFYFDFAEALAVTPDGKIVAVGETGFHLSEPRVGVVRFDANGKLDPTFSGDGFVETRFPGKTYVIPTDVLVQRNGRVVVAGGAVVEDRAREDFRSDFLLMRYLPDGRLDGSFGKNGRVLTNVDADDFPRTVVLQPGGKLVVTGHSGNVRDGDAIGGIFRKRGAPQPRGDAHGGRIFGGGPEGGDPGGAINFALLRYTPGGDMDTTFGTRGKVITRFSGSSGALASALQPDGKVVVAGVAQGVGGVRRRDFAVARYNE